MKALLPILLLATLTAYAGPVRSQRVASAPPPVKRTTQRVQAYSELPPPLPGVRTMARWTITWQYTGLSFSNVVCRVYESVSLTPGSWQVYATVPPARTCWLDVLMMPKTFFKVCAFDGTEHWDWIENLTADP